MSAATTAKKLTPASRRVADRLTHTWTAFRDFAAFEAAMADGYVPTIRHWPMTGKSGRADINRLRRFVTGAGFRYFDGDRVV